MYNWSLVSCDARVVSGVPKTRGSEELVDVTIAHSVTFTCATVDGDGEHTNSIILGEPLAADEALTPDSPEEELLAAAQHALGLGGVERCQTHADVASTMQKKGLTIEVAELSTPVGVVSEMPVAPAQPAVGVKVIL